MISRKQETRQHSYSSEIEFEPSEQLLFDKNDILTIRLNDKQLNCIDNLNDLIKNTPYPVVVISFELINQPVLCLDKIINIIKENKDVKFFLTCLNKEEQSIFKNAIDFMLSSENSKQEVHS